MQTVEHLEGTMTDSEEGHSSEVNLFSPCIKLGTDWETSAVFAIFLNGITRSETRKNPECCAVIMKGTQACVTIGQSIVDPISTEKHSFGSTETDTIAAFKNP